MLSFAGSGTFAWISWGWDVLLLGAAMVAAFILGFFAGRMIATAQSVQQLAVRFDFSVQGQHPDRSGGLRPLGEVCLMNAFILLVPAIHLGIWILLLRGSGVGFVYASMIPILLGLAALAFFRPLFSVLKAMISSCLPWRAELDALSADIDQLTRQQLHAAISLQTSVVNELGQKLESLQRTYRENLNLPTWPFDGLILGKFLTSMVIPIIGLITSLGFRFWH
jgi:hypothetical protein